MLSPHSSKIRRRNMKVSEDDGFGEKVMRSSSMIKILK